MGHIITVTAEPIIDFDLTPFSDMFRLMHPKYVSIGADSKKRLKLEGTPEPSPEKTITLIEDLSKFTVVKMKDNLERIIGNYAMHMLPVKYPGRVIT